MGGGVAGEIEAVSAHSNADTVYFGLGWSNGGNHLGVCDFTTLGNSQFPTKKTVLVPVVMRVLMPWARRPKFLTIALIQVSPLGARMRCQYLSA